jgi:hypothetical protein
LLNESIRRVEEERSREMCTRKVELNLYKNIDLLLDELCFILSKKRVFTHFIMNLQEEYDEKVAEEVISIVSGAYEFLVALAFAKLHNVDVYAWSSNCGKEGTSAIESSKFLLWNGLLDFKDDFIVPYMSRAGLSDIELCEGYSCALIEVTLGLSPRTLYYELNEILKHSSALGHNVKNRILVLSVCGREFESFARFVSDAYPGKVEVKSIYSIIAALHKGRKHNKADQCDYMMNYCKSGASNIEMVIQELLKKEDKDFLYVAKALKERGYIVLPAMVHRIYMLSLSI